MITKGGEVKILDFGLAKLLEVLPETDKPSASSYGQFLTLSANPSERRTISELAITRSGVLLGTPLYMAPEAWRGQPATPQTDVYSLGALLYELCTGRPPHQAENAMVLGYQVIDRDAPPLAQAAPGVDAQLAEVVTRCLQRDPSRRFASGEEVRAALERIAAKAPAISRGVAMAALGLLLLVLLSVSGLALARDRQAKRQAELAQRLAQQIAAMEWLLRSARQLPLHALEYEKDIVRKRMSRIQAELDSYGEQASGLAHYALGRGHMALHEYPQALTHLRLALVHGTQSAEVHYAFGVVLGKHYEQAMYEARLAGGGDWARKQLKEIEPKYLAPAIVSLQRSRSMNLEAPQYLEGLIAYYQRDYEAALRHAAAALREAPWLYEAAKLAGDVHLEQALLARDSGRNPEADREFAASVQSFTAAAAIGQSDGEVYEGLAESWVRQIEMAAERGLPINPAYDAATAASEKITVAEPQSIAGPLKQAFAAMMTIAASEAGAMSEDCLRVCLAAADAVLQRQPEHPYARDAAANCNILAFDGARARGRESSEPLHKALSLLEPTVQKYPHFLWGMNDLGIAYSMLGAHLQLHGSPAAKGALEKALARFTASAALDPTYVKAALNALQSLRWLLLEARTQEEAQRVLAQADSWLVRCTSVNRQATLCFNSYFQDYAYAASRDLLSGQDPQPRLARALSALAEVRELGGVFLDAEQYAALLHWVAASDRVRRKQDPAPELAELRADLGRCFAIAPQDAMCRTLDAQAEWVRADWLAQTKQPVTETLESAATKAVLATRSPEVFPDAWLTLAEAHLRLARLRRDQPAARELHLAEGLSGAARVFAINPNHAPALALQGALQLLRAETEVDGTTRQELARTAARSLEQALKNDPFLSARYLPLLHTARAMEGTSL